MSTVRSRIIKKVIIALALKRSEFIKFPDQLDDIKRDFYNIAGMPYIVGAIDGTHKNKKPGYSLP